MKRKTFLSAAAMLAFTRSKAETVHPFPVVSADPGDETYWTALRAAMFPLEDGRIYLNNGTMGITPYPVLSALNKGFEQVATKGAYPGHNDDLLKSLASLLKCDTSELAITKNVSEGINHACWGIDLKKGDEVLMTMHEHVGGCLAWINRARLDGIVIRKFELGKTADETLNNLKQAVTRKTRVIAVPHIPCTIGQILPVKEICTFARSKGIVSAIDGAHPLGMIQLDLHDIGCDYYSGCLHKWALAPLGLGFFYVRQDMLKDTRCTHVAAYSTTDFNMSTEPPAMGQLVDTAHRFFYGTFCGPLFEAGNAALNLYKQIGPDRIEQRCRGLAAHLQQRLLDMGSRIEMVTPTEAASRGAQISFRIKNGNAKANQEFCNQMHGKKIIIRYVGESGIDCIRVSTHYYNNKEEISTLLKELEQFVS